MKGLALVLLAAALAAGWTASPVRADQTFWTLSSGPAPSPWPTPTYWPVDWYGSLYYPVVWPICVPPNVRRCRPLHAHVWPPSFPHGLHPVPMAKPPRT